MSRSPQGARRLAKLARSLLGVSTASTGLLVALGPGQAGAAGSSAPLALIANAVSCVSATMCIAVGEAPSLGTRSAGAEVAEILNGTPKAFHKVPGVTGLDAVSCPGGAHPCEATGFAPSGDVVLSISPSGAPGQKVSVPLLLTAISCTGADVCEGAAGVGNSITVLSVRPGAVGTPHTVALPKGGGAIDSVAISCSSATSCHAGVTYSTGKAFDAYAFAVTGGSPSTASEVSKTYGIAGIACPAAGLCFVDGSSIGGAAMVASLAGPRLVGVHVVSGVSQLTAISCGTAKTCSAVGSTFSTSHPSGHAIVVPVVSGVPGTGTAVPAAATLASVASVAPSFYEAVGPQKFGLNSGQDEVTSN